jgi:hypothetical protein
MTLAVVIGSMWCSCDSSSTPDPIPIEVAKVEFSASTISVPEGNQQVKVVVSSTVPLAAGDEFKVRYTAGPGMTVGTDADLFLSPAPISGVITFKGPLTTLEFLVNSNFDSKDETDEVIDFTLEGVSGVELGVQKNLSITVTDGTLHEGLVAEYTFTGGLLDTSGKGNHGTNHGASLTSGKSGNPNTAYVFSGSNYVTVPSNEFINFDTSEDYTVSLWTEPASIQNDMGGTINDIIRKWVGDAQGYAFGISYYNTSSINPGAIAGARYDGSACGHIPQIISGSVSAQFHHVLLRKSGSQIELYVDGQNAGSTVDNTTCSTANISDLYIGCRGNLLRCFTGKVDDIRIYDRAITNNEITGLFRMP